MRHFILMGLAVIWGPFSWGTDAESYEYAMKFRFFMEEGIFLEEVSNEAANKLVAAGIVSNDPLIKEQTIGALGGLAGHIANSAPGPFGRLPSRSFSKVPGLKKFLMNEWRESWV